jgi:hypothetical protein
MTAGSLPRPDRLGWIVALALLGPACGEGLPDIPLKLSKNCNELEVVPLVPRVGDAAGEEVIDVAADGTLGETAWVLVRRATATGDTEVVVQRLAAGGVEHETILPVEATASLALAPAPESGRVWVVRDEPGFFELWRVAPEDESRPLLGSTDLSTFPSAGPPCLSCDFDDWPRRLFFLPTGAALVALPRESLDASLVVWVAPLETTGAQIWYGSEHRLNFEPPCDDSTPESQIYCEEQRMNLRYPEITLLGIQQDPRQSTTILFGHRTRRVTYDGDPLPIDSTDVFMVALQLDADGVPAGVLRSYSGFYTEGPGAFENGVPPMPTADPPYGVAIDRFAAYGLFSNGGQLPRIVQLPESDPEFTELTDRVPLTLDTSLVQLDRDVALGRIVDGAWELTKLFPDDPSQSTVLLHETDEPIEQVISGGVGTLLLRKQGAPPEVVRLRCPEGGDAEEDE